MVEKRMVQADRVNAEYIYENVQMCVANAGKGVPGGRGKRALKGNGAGGW